MVLQTIIKWQVFNLMAYQTLFNQKYITTSASVPILLGPNLFLSPFTLNIKSNLRSASSQFISLHTTTQEDLQREDFSECVFGFLIMLYMFFRTHNISNVLI